jgi:hypothetical protein
MHICKARIVQAVAEVQWQSLLVLVGKATATATATAKIYMVSIQNTSARPEDLRIRIHEN